MISKLLRSSNIKFKIVCDPKSYGKYYVMYKAGMLSRWRYYRRPKGQLKNDQFFAHIWSWNTPEGAQTFINQQVKSLNMDCISQEEFENLQDGDRVELRYGYQGTVLGDMTKHVLNDTQMIKIKQDKRKFVCPYFRRNEIKSIVSKRES
jgi:hypothetical protein